MRYLFALLAFFVANVLVLAGDGNRLSYLDSNEVWYPHKDFPKLITPQWVGEEGVECVVTFAIDDMRDPAKYEAYLRPILQRLKQIDGRAPVSIMTNSVKPDDPQLQAWLQEGLSLECHTADHPCPLLAGGSGVDGRGLRVDGQKDGAADPASPSTINPRPSTGLSRAKATYDKCVDLMASIPNNKPVAFRMPCCDSLNTVSPRFYSEIFNKTTPGGNFLQLDSSVFNLYTADDPSIPRELVTDPDGREKFRKYIPRGFSHGGVVHNQFVNTIENYPYPYVIQRLCWEFPCMVPSDWEAQHLHKPNNPDTIRDLKAALDITVLKQGVFNLVFHPHGWIKAEQVVELIDHAVARHGRKVKFLTFKECVERLNKNVLGGCGLRNTNGNDNGVRVLDIDSDGIQDTVVANAEMRSSYLWRPAERKFAASTFPISLVPKGALPAPTFGVWDTASEASVFSLQGDLSGEWRLRRDKWELVRTNRTLPKLAPPIGGIQCFGFLTMATRFTGNAVSIRDIDHDGVCEVIQWSLQSTAVPRRESESRIQVALPLRPHTGDSFVSTWIANREVWRVMPFQLPFDSGGKLRIADAPGFVDLNEDGFEDIVFSNYDRYGAWLFESKEKGWSIELLNVKRGEQTRTDVDLPPIVRLDGSNNGFFVRDRHLCWINEDTDGLPDFIMRVAFDKLLGDRLPDAKSPEAAKQSMRVAPGYRVDLVAHEPLTMDPVAFDWGPDGKLWIAEMADYPNGVPDDEPDPTLPPSPRRGGPGRGGDEGAGNDSKTAPLPNPPRRGEGTKPAKTKRAGRIRFLEDTDGDGQYDKTTLFLEGVPFPNGVIAWKKGVLVSAAPDIFYAEDTDGDGKADVKKVLFTGFAEGNQQHRANGFSRGLDNWLYLANGDSGGTVTVVGSLNSAIEKGVDGGSPLTPGPSPQGGEGRKIDIRGRDIRIRPDTGEIEAVSGQSQFGRNRDDWGDWFGNNNSRPMYHYVLDDHYLRRNPHLAAPNPQKDVSVAPGAAPVFPASRTLTRFNDFHTANRFTSACSSMVYRDEVLGQGVRAEGRGAEDGKARNDSSLSLGPQPFALSQIFISEPVHNLVHREIMRPDGLSFTSQRAAGEEQSEFLSSTDNWFRPTQLKTGPDGALYVADMYRLVIEHPQWIPIEWQKKLDLRAGHDKGRLWRVAPVGTKLRAVPRLDKLTTAELVAALDSSNGWQRDLAQQLLIDRADPAAVPLLRRMAMHGQTAIEPQSGGRVKPGASAPGSLVGTSPAPEGRPSHGAPNRDRPSGANEPSQRSEPGADAPGFTRSSLRDLAHHKSALARLHALCTLDGLKDGLTVQVVVAALNDPHPGVRRHAVRLCEQAGLPKGDLIEPLARLVDDADSQVRLQLASTLGEIKHTQADVALGKLAAKANGQPWMTAAVLSSLRADNLGAVMAEAMQNGGDQTGLLQQLLPQATAFKSDAAVVSLLMRVTEPWPDGTFSRWQFSAFEQYSISVERRGEALPLLGSSDAVKLPERIGALLVAARKLAMTSDALVSDRVAAVRILGASDDRSRELVFLADLLAPQQPPEVQSAALTTFGRMNDPLAANKVLDAYRSLAPGLRAEACSVLLSRDAWRDELLAALESKKLAPTDLDPASRQRLLDHKSKTVRERAAKILAVDPNTDRAKLVADYLPTVRAGGDVQHGSQLFAKRCAQCHKLGSVGHVVGPDLASLTDKSPEAMLTAILDPNRAVETKFVTFTAVTKSGVTHTGILANETASSFTLRAAEAKETTLLRNELDELQGSTKSLMPEGLEREVSPTDAAALIAYIRNNVPLPARKTFPGNEPTVVRPNADGSITLTPFTAEIYGPTIVIEEKHKNLGWWSSADDTVVWTFNVPRAGHYAVSWTWACEASAAGNTCVIEAAGKSFRHKVTATSGWDDYQSADLGELELPAGEVRLTMKPASRPLPALADVKSVTLTPTE